MAADPVRLQEESNGILIDKYHGKYIDCVTQEGVLSKAETYIYRCSADKVCCPTGCCFAGAAGFPVWLLILILVLAFLLALLLLGYLIYYFCVRRQRRAAKIEMINGTDKRVVVTGTPPRVEIYDRNRTLNDADSSKKITTTAETNQSPSSSVDSKGRHKKKSASQRNKVSLLRYNGNENMHNTADVTILTDLESDAEAGAKNINLEAAHQSQLKHFPGSQSYRSVNESRIDQRRTDKSFEESYEKPPKPIPVSYHDRSEISVEKRPLLNRLERPEEQKARMIYYKEEKSRNESFDEHVDYD